MLILSNKKEKERLIITIDNDIAREILVFNRKEVSEEETLNILKDIKQEVTKKLKLNRNDYFKLVNHLAGSINDYKKYLAEN